MDINLACDGVIAHYICKIEMGEYLYWKELVDRSGILNGYLERNLLSETTFSGLEMLKDVY